MLVVGLTGNYGMGKSTVLEMFRKMGAATIDSDEIVDGLLSEEVVLSSIRTAFGDGVFLKDGALNRTLVASLIFKDKKMRESLEGIIHPLVFEKIEQSLKRIREKEAGDKVVIIEIPLLFEAGRLRGFDRTITVHADRATVLRRLQKKGIGTDDAEARLGSQMAIEEKMDRADFAIDNNGGPGETEIRVRQIYDRLLAESRR